MSKAKRKPEPETGHDPFLLHIDDLRPSPENSTLYRPVLPAEPSILALADDIRRNGVLDPIVVSADGFIVSGHRRHVAAKLAGLTEVPVVRHEIHSDDPGFVALLASFNKQREKTFDETAREAVVEATADESYAALVSDRIERARAATSGVKQIDLGARRERSKISRAKHPFLTAILAVLEELKEFLPVSDRQIHYGLLNLLLVLIHASKPGSRYRNDKRSYKALTDLLTRARLPREGLIPMDAIADPTRPVVQWDVHRGPRGFLDKQMANFLRGYWRDLLQSQPCHIEVIGEKNTIEGIIRPICMKYTVPYTLGRGYCSIRPRHDLVERFEKSGKETLVLIVVSDFDPDGDVIAQNFPRSLRDDFDLDEDRIVPVRAALTPEQIRGLHLPEAGKAKRSSTNYRRFIRTHESDDVYELEALAPVKLQELLAQAIESVLDIDLFNAEVEAERADSQEIENLRRRVVASMPSEVKP